ncbi:MAG: RloB domain-containing protein [Okeania sp. SIO3I5]|uniref:RloB family protein n=1 Tax=Okeania sp. SIO3I5 TaxID=2607805 RepID=UPI0013B6C35B|nr:RloB family protein [Okeania sp. SIO3I5]NEQ39045.1 RloB domain-containing protein [Okeania sp. SIO3I5]
MARKKASGKNYQSSRNGKSQYSRSRNKTVETREIQERFLIVCEGTKTEPNYFKSFPVPKDVIEIDVRGVGKNTISLVKEAIEIKKEDNDYDQIWCVFDRDSFPVKNFKEAINYAQNNDIKVAYSNQAFELWYLLHFNYRDTAMSRTQYKKLLTKNMNQKYEKNSDEMYEILASRQPQAIKNAERLLEQYNPPDPANNNPSTTVHLLVKQLNRFVRK